MRITSAGNVGIGSTVPGEKLTVVAADNFNTTNISAFYPNNLSQGIGFGFDEIRKIGTNTNGNLFINAKGTGDIIFQNTATGKVGIGTTSPQKPLEVNGNIRQTTYSQAFSVPGSSSGSFTWTHNFGYQPIIMITLDQTAGGFCDYVNTSYAHINSNQLTIFYTNRNAATASGTVRWIVVY